MGQSATANLRYGYRIGGPESGWELVEYDPVHYSFPPSHCWIDGSADVDDEDWGGFAEEVETRLLSGHGFDDRGGWRKDTTYFVRARAALNEIGVEVLHTGTHDFAEYSLVLNNPNFRVTWGSQRIDLIPTPEPSWDEQLGRAITALEITPTSKPGWILGAMYG